MTRKLEEELGLPPIEDVKIPDEFEETLPTVEESQQEIEVTKGKMDIADRVDSALPVVEGLEQLDREMDDYARRAMDTFEDLCDLGKNVEDRHAAPIFDSASKMLTAALTAKQAKMDKKLKMVELQMRKAKLDLDEKKLEHKIGSDEPEEITGEFIGDRASMLDSIMEKMKEKDK